jgi:hypothetical protein
MRCLIGVDDVAATGVKNPNKEGVREDRSSHETSAKRPHKGLIKRESPESLQSKEILGSGALMSCRDFRFKVPRLGIREGLCVMTKQA